MDATSRPRLNGIDLAIALLQALADAGGSARSQDLAEAIGAPRATFHRISKILAAEGLVTLPRGRIAIGQATEGFLRHNTSKLQARAPASVEPDRPAEAHAGLVRADDLVSGLADINASPRRRRAG